MNWYLQSEKDSDVVISTRIRFARNLKEFKFNLKEKDDINKLKNKIKENIYAIGYGLKYFELKDMDDITKMSLVEKNIITPETLVAMTLFVAQSNPKEKEVVIDLLMNMLNGL